MEYFAFGETFIEEHKNSHNSPFKYNGKELDEESGLYYYGARYYDPRISIWASVDPLMEKYPHLSPYIYCANNPIMFIDPDGREHTPVIKYLQTAINNYAKEMGRRRYEAVLNRALNFNRLATNKVLSTLNNNKYLAKSESIIENDRFEGKADFSVYNLKLKNASYTLHERDDLDKYNITDIAFKGDKNGPYHRHGDGFSGYIIDFQGFGNLPLAYIEVGSYENLVKIKNEMSSNANTEYQKLLMKNPIIKEYVELMDYRENVLLPAFENKDNSKEDLKSYKEKEKIYNNKTKNFVKNRDKMIK